MVRVAGVGAVVLAVAALLALLIRAADALPGDFQTYYSAATDVRSGVPLYVDALRWRDVGATIELPRLFENNPQLRVDFPPYVYPPAFAFAFVPLTVLPMRVAALLWFIFVVGCLLATAWILTRMLFPTRLRNQLVIALGLSLMLSLFQPIRATLTSAQVDPILLLLVTLALWSFSRRHDSRAALWLALAVGIKPAVGFLILYFLWKRAYRTTLVFGTVSALLLALPTAFLGFAQTLDFVAAARYWSSPAFAVTPFNQAPYGLLLRLFTVNPFTVPIVDAPPLLVTALQAALIGATLQVLAVSISRTRAAPIQRLALEYGLVLIAMLLVSPLSEDIHYGYLVVPLMAGAATLMHASAGWTRSARLGLGAALVVVWLYFSLPALRSIDMLFRTFQQGPVPAPRLLLSGMHIYGLAVLAALIVLIIHRRRRLSTIAGVQLSGSS